MMATSHILTAVSGWAVLAPLAGVDVTPGSIAFVIAGALLPDIDHPGSTIGRRLRPVSSAISGVFGHRGITHSMLAIVALVAVAWCGLALEQSLIVALAGGYLLHLAGDLVADSGIPLLWPLRRRFAIPLVVTGGIREVILVVGVVGGALWLEGVHLALKGAY